MPTSTCESWRIGRPTFSLMGWHVVVSCGDGSDELEPSTGVPWPENEPSGPTVTSEPTDEKHVCVGSHGVAAHQSTNDQPCGTSIVNPAIVAERASSAGPGAGVTAGVR